MSETVERLTTIDENEKLGAEDFDRQLSALAERVDQVQISRIDRAIRRM